MDLSSDYINAVKIDGNYYRYGDERFDVFVLINVFPELGGLRAITVKKDAELNIIPIKTKTNKYGKVEYIHPDLD